MLDLEAVRGALRAQEPTALLEQREGQWLDAKSVPYELRDPRAVEELAKDDAVIPVDRASVTPPPRERGGFSLCRLGFATDQPGP
ncbi:hypothetical protein ACFCX0_31615 [Streptomyces sp. NPDC056352]|uniref:hypothetical protein n=1 Tax=Streptomyces sp. NPDC056352 TaxID=3345791 RepID=UPI0035DB8F28